MSDQEVLYSTQGAVATITLNRPKRGNALSSDMVTLFGLLVQRAIDDPAVRVIVVTANGKYFCTGMDLTGGGGVSSHANNTYLGNEKEETKEEETATTPSLFQLLRKAPKPTIAKINGPALGGGVGIVFACNIRVVHPSAYFSMPEVHRGLIPAMISEVIVPQLGPFLSKQYMLTGERVPADEALRVGFVSAVVGKEDDALDKKTQEYLDLLLQGGPGALRDVKALVDVIDSRGGDPEASSKYVREAFVKMVTSEEAAHGIGAFASRKKPNWDDFGLGKTKSKL
ncbi:EnoyL-CoA hydratase [Actinomortierella ambigua]|uniref:EnoyL-CoA hydratase n=1 Tax=Actinomortierella ambigua TaxID=1343610 RepID=A0A9P6TWI5_9FUNG|nr:EnoyL-CoA hydratase [Actinomortierella ambigua]